MPLLSRRRLVSLAGLAAAGLAFGRSALAAPGGAPTLQVFKSPWCGCCDAWVEHVAAAGYPVRVEEVEDLTPLKAMLGIAPELQSCHTALVEGYVVEGHVPARELARLLAERPAATGLAVPGMPLGSPGMEHGDIREPYAVVLFKGDERQVFARY